MNSPQPKWKPQIDIVSLIDWITNINIISKLSMKSVLLIFKTFLLEFFEYPRESEKMDHCDINKTQKLDHLNI
jgi:hypothetical protein